MLVMAILAPFAATMIQLAISRTREYQADASGAQLTHHPLYLANALRKLETANERMPMADAHARDGASVYRQSAERRRYSRGSSRPIRRSKSGFAGSSRWRKGA